jgi:hypothetical protein
VVELSGSLVFCQENIGRKIIPEAKRDQEPKLQKQSALKLAGRYKVLLMIINSYINTDFMQL